MAHSFLSSLQHVVQMLPFSMCPVIGEEKGSTIVVEGSIEAEGKQMRLSLVCWGTERGESTKGKVTRNEVSEWGLEPDCTVPGTFGILGERWRMLMLNLFTSEKK